MDAGKLDREITLQRATQTRDALNNVVYGWSPPAWSRVVRAAKQDVSHQESIRAQEVGADITTRFTIRWSPEVADLDSKDRLIFGGKPYQIIGTRELGRREGIEIAAVARTDK